MSRPHQAGKRRKTKLNHTPKSPVITNSQMDPDPITSPIGQFVAETSSNSIRDHASLLNNLRIQPIQRQLMAQQIGQTFGNNYLHRVMLQMKKDNARQQPSSPKSLTPSKKGPVEISDTILPDGQVEQTIRIPFAQVINRAAEDSETAAGDQEPEAPIFVAEILAEEEEIDELDEDSSVSATASYQTTVSRGGAGPSGYGVTRSTAAWKNVNISSSFGTFFNSGVYTVTGDFEYKVRWQVRSGTGPSSEVDIANDADPDVKACNYQYIAKDLTPNMGDLNGRPPRDDYWAEDLTEKHELFHANERSTFGRDGATAAQTWLNTQTASSANQVRNTLLPQALDEGKRAINTRMAAPPGKEQRAYGDGAPSYLARATSIKTKGDAGDYGQVSARVTVHPKGGGIYEIVPGDTLWAIAERTYGHGRYWREIHRANPGKSRNGGNLIFPGTILDLPSISIDQELSLIMSFDSNFVLTESVVVPGGGSHEFLTAAKDIFTDSTDCSGDVSIDVLDAESNTLMTMNWGLPGDATSRSGNLEVTAKIAP